MIHPTAVIDKQAQIDKNVEIGPYSIIGKNVIIGENTVIGPHVVIDPNVTIGSGCRIFQFASVGGIPQDLKFKGEESFVKIGDNTVIREFVTINRGTELGGGLTKIGSNGLLMAYAHVAHDCILGQNNIMANCATLAGHVILGDYVTVGGLTAIQQFVRIGDYVYIAGHSGIRNDIPPYTRVSGDERVKLLGIDTIKLGRCGFPEETINTLKKAYRIIFRSKKTIKEALDHVKTEVEQIPEVVNLVHFIKTSERGITR
jgi:UDP-N-acetylglucosamine acyltransferase